jgi:hypothetical protein
MGQRNVRVVVGQGDPQRQGFLRTILEDDGYDVVGEAATTSQLARLLTDEHPDVVVLDDGIGVAAVQLAAEIAPSAKIIVVWPAAVVPIAGAIRVEPSEVLATLAGAVGLAVGIAGPASLGPPAWVEKIRKDPATLREMLAAKGGVPTRPSVTELQRRGHRLHPSPGSPRRAARTKPVAEPLKDRDAIVTPIPIAAAAAAAAAMSGGAVTPTPAEESWNRRLGVLALGGAAVAGALMIALAFSNRAPSITSAEPLFIPPIIQPSDGPTTGGGNGGPGSQPHDATNGPGAQGPGGTANGGTANGATGGAGTTSGIGGGFDTNVRGQLSGPTTSGGGGGTTGGSTGSPGGPRSNEHLPSSHASSGNGGSSGGGTTTTAPGQSASHNPHGGPPGWEHRPTSHPSGGSANAHGGGADHANSHAHKQ